MAEGTAPTPLERVQELLKEIDHSLEQGKARCARSKRAIAKVDGYIKIEEQLIQYAEDHLVLPWKLFLIFMAVALALVPIAWAIYPLVFLGAVLFGVLSVLSHAVYMHFRLQQQKLGKTLEQELDQT